jgi:NAD(P)-dependent dehydrogenase (short-subunit alcohol dehydrogenase family)
MRWNESVHAPREGELFAGYNVIVTGASSGIGRDVALMFAGEGANVALFARRKPLLLQLAHEIADLGGTALPIVCDVTDAKQVQTAVDRVEANFTGIDVVVNNAGVLIPAPFRDARLRDLRRMMDVNYFGAVHVTQAALPVMEDAGSGNIVNIASIAGRRGGVTLSGYSASKSALIAFTEALRIELFGTGVTASVVVPASVDTEMLRNPEWESRSWAVGEVKMPTEWVTWGVVTAITLGLAEVDIPPGIVTAEKVAGLFPDLSAAWLGAGSRMIDLMNQWMRARRRSRRSYDF